jgi:hypothetical protein
MLIECARDRLLVSVEMAVETSYTDDVSCFIGTPKIIDTYSVGFIIEGREIWVSKPFIVSVEKLGKKEIL